MIPQPTTYGYCLFVCVASLSMNILFRQGSLVHQWISRIYIGQITFSMDNILSWSWLGLMTNPTLCANLQQVGLQQYCNRLIPKLL